jgi:hypothetical protein
MVAISKTSNLFKSLNIDVLSLARRIDLVSDLRGTEKVPRVFTSVESQTEKTPTAQGREFGGYGRKDRDCIQHQKWKEKIIRNYLGMRKDVAIGLGGEAPQVIDVP